MKKLFTLTSLLFCSLFAFSQTNSLDSAWVRDNYIKMERMVPMRDGKKLFTAIYVPKDNSEKHPILMRRTPYASAPYGENNFPESFWNSYYRLYLRENYIMVVQDVRGRYMSEGEFVDVRPFNPTKKATEIDEASDTYDAVDWLIKNIPNNNGNVGVFGISYPGFYATMAALSGHPSVKAVSPQAPVTDWFMGDDFHHNGAFMLMDGFRFYSGFGKPRPLPTTKGATGYNFQTQDNYQFYLQTGTLKDFARLMGDSIQFWKDLYSHPNLDYWWKARNTRNFVQHIPSSANTLVVGGQFDAEDAFGAWNLYKAVEAKAKNNNKIVIGPWFHGQWGGRGDGSNLGNVRFGSKTSEWYQNNIEVPFFNYHLKGKGDISKLAEATVFFSGENNWKQLPQWPPASSQMQNIYLQPNGSLGWNKPTVGNAFTQYTSDPSKPVPYTEDVHLNRTREYMTDDQRFAARRPDVLFFQTDVLQEDLTLAGPLNADLFVSLSTTDADFVVKLIDVFPDTFKYAEVSPYPMGGYQMLVRGEVMRGRYRKSFENPVAFTPGKVEEVSFYLPDIAHTFKKGHRLMVQIQSSWFPLVDRNPQKFVNIYEASAADFQKADIKLYHSNQYPSSIRVSVMK
ncbi:MAG: CocE/NonD family hydrolase [Chitinophagaceae bacterium]|nr:MAG: CocE/NonD family hydrolase [Chitinophagaceae bacterium]